MDFIEDRGYINSSFMSDYKLDLNNAKLHFWQFIELIEGLTENCILNRVRNIRNADLSEIKNYKDKKKMIDAKKHFALKNTQSDGKKIKEFTDKQKENIDNFYKLAGLNRKE